MFAPTNDAFAALNLPADLTPAAIAKVLTYHVVSGRVLSSDLGASQSVPTFDEQPLSITVDNGKVNINEYSQVVTANIETCNAVVHVVNEVRFQSPLDVHAQTRLILMVSPLCSRS